MIGRMCRFLPAGRGKLLFHHAVFVAVAWLQLLKYMEGICQC
jgi:hypothetical protein